MNVNQIIAAPAANSLYAANEAKGHLMQPRAALYGQSLVPLACLLAVPIYAALFVALQEPLAAQLTTAAVFAASWISSLAGLAFSPLFGAMLFQFRHDPVVIVQIMLLCSLASRP